MQLCIDQAKTKLVDIIEQINKDVGDHNLHVGFVGWVVDSVRVAQPSLSGCYRPDGYLSFPCR